MILAKWRRGCQSCWSSLCWSSQRTADSDALGLENDQRHARLREIAQIRRGCLALGRRKSRLKVRHALESEFCDQIGGWTPGDRVQRPIVHDIGPQTWNSLGDRDVGLKVVAIKCRRISGLMVEGE